MQTPRDFGDSGALPDPVIHDFAPVARELMGCEDRRELLKGSRRGPIKRLIEETIAESGASVLSFDVFDTFLLRDTRCEARRFLETARHARTLVAQQLGLADGELSSDVDFLIARADAMDLCYRTRKAVEGCREGHVRDILRVARRALGLQPEADQILLQAEIESETDSLVLNPVLADIARDFRADGGKVVLVSDMYLGKEEIAALVTALDSRDGDIADDVFSSADHVVSKRSGKMFRLIEEQLDEKPDAFVHVGDALEGDVFRVRDAGWAAVHFPISRIEVEKRSADLRAFVLEMKRRGHDVSRWAKV